jgi:hypothetical protein
VGDDDVRAFMADGGFERAGPKPLGGSRASNLFNRVSLDE